MAEKKFVNLITSLIFGIFVLSMFIVALNDWDSQYTNTKNIGSLLENVGENISSEYSSNEIELWQSTNNGSTFSITTGSDVDVRGTSEAITATKNSPSTMVSFLQNVGSIMYTHKLITGLIISLIIIYGIVLFLRFLRPGGA